MLLYIIPFVLLLVVAIVLKKRGSGQQDTDSSRSKRKFESKKKAKARYGTATTDITDTQDILSVEKTPKELDPDLRRQIENLIRDKNFSTAEAVINQALNADNAQHDLYLLLLQIHIEQNDQFSINQLLSHLRSLNLHDVVREAEKRIAEKKEQARTDSIQFTPIQLPDEAPVTTVVEPEKAVTPQVKAVDFDLLKNDLSDETHSKSEPTHSDLSFEKLEEELHCASTTVQETAPVSKVEEHKHLEFNIESSNKTEIDEPRPNVVTKHVHLSIEPRTIESKGPEHFAEKLDFGKNEDVIPGVAKTEHHDAVFQHHHETPHKTQIEPVHVEEEVQEAPALEFKFDLTKPAIPQEKQSEPEVEPIQQTNITFNFEAINTEVHAEPQPVVETQELVFSFDKPDTQPEIEPETVIAPAPTVEVAAEPLSITSFDSLPNAIESAVAPVEEPVTETKAPADYVVQQFPELAALSDTKLNLSLAEQYIRLGAFSSARALLEDSQVQYHADELDRAKYLLNQIAS